MLITVYCEEDVILAAAELSLTAAQTLNAIEMFNFLSVSPAEVSADGNVTLF